MKTDIWMPLFIGDYLADTTRLTTLEHGAYLLLIMDYWRNGSPPNNDSILANITRMQIKDWLKIKNVVMAFFKLESQHYSHSRIDKELHDAKISKEKAEEKARKAAEKRWGQEAAKQEQSPSSSNATSIASSNQQAMHDLCPSPSPSPSPIKTLNSKAGASATRLPKDWQPSESDISFCLKERPELNPQSVADQFRDYWIGIAGVKGRKLDWEATWRNWVRNEKSFNAKQKPMKGHGVISDEKFNEWLEPKREAING
ncbi:MAG: DUF1376 domain-containing protein [Pseudomonadota bacterium]